MKLTERATEKQSEKTNLKHIKHRSQLIKWPYACVRVCVPVSAVWFTVVRISFTSTVTFQLHFIIYRKKL